MKRKVKEREEEGRRLGEEDRQKKKREEFGVGGKQINMDKNG